MAATAPIKQVSRLSRQPEIWASANQEPPAPWVKEPGDAERAYPRRGYRFAGAMVPAGSLAETTLRTEVVTSGASPVRVDSCRAALSDSRLYIAAAVDFTNISPQPVNAVRFVFDVQDTFSAITQSMGLDWLGTFAPGVPILARRNLAGTVGAVGQENNSLEPRQRHLPRSIRPLCRRPSVERRRSHCARCAGPLLSADSCAERYSSNS